MSELKVSYKLKENKVRLFGYFGYKKVNLLTGKTNYIPLRYYTDVVVKVSEWDSTNKVPFDPKKLSELNRIKNLLLNIFDYLKGEEQEITPELLKFELDRKLGKIAAKNEKTKEVIIFTEFLENVTAKDKSRAQRTLTGFATLKNQILNFQKQERLTLDTQTLDEITYLKFVGFVRENQGRINSVYAILKNLQTTISDIKRVYKKQKIEVFTPSEELASKDKVKKVDPDKVYFDLNMIQSIMKYQPKNERLKNTKLILLVLIFTGCRYSDVFKISPKNYSNNGRTFRYTRFSDTKQSGDVLIPLLKPLEDAIKENGNKLPSNISSQKFNEYVKELTALIGGEFSEFVEIPYVDSFGKTKYDVNYFYKFVSSHIGRRTFVTAFINHIPVTILSKLTGHKIVNKSIIHRYNKISLLDNAVLFLDQLKHVQNIYKDHFPFKLV